MNDVVSRKCIHETYSHSNLEQVDLVAKDNSIKNTARSLSNRPAMNFTKLRDVNSLRIVMRNDLQGIHIINATLAFQTLTKKRTVPGMA